jgi:hypothetical protein
MAIKKLLISVLVCCPMVISAGTRLDVRGTRYCEIIVSDSWFRCAVYTTEGLNNCPDNLWNAITKKDVKNATGASRAILEGPRYWAMDKIQTTPLIQVKEKKFKQLLTKKIAYVKITFQEIIAGTRPYYRHIVDLNNTFTYDAGKPVYELIDPKGRVFVMQSYKLHGAEKTAGDLSKLAKQLNLPQGWQFKTGVLSQTKQLKTNNNKAVVLHDNLKNRYQWSTHDFLTKS